MPILALELNDSGVRVARSTRDDLLPIDHGQVASPGVASVDGGQMTTGVDAARQASLRPLVTHTRFWDQLGTQPIAARSDSAPTSAAVAMAHLRTILADVRRSDDEVVMAVPPTYDTRQLGVLVSIARELQLDLRGLIAMPLAVDLNDATEGTTMRVDLSLHRATLSALTTTDAGVELGPVEPCPDIGLESFRRQWAGAIGAEFVRKTRFDPLHDASTEQELHDRLGDIVAGVQREGSQDVDLDVGTSRHRVTVAEAMLNQAGQNLVFDLVAALQRMLTSTPADTIVLSHEAASVPGLRALITRQTGLSVHTLGAGAAARGLAQGWPDRFVPTDSEGVGYHTWRRRATTSAS